LKLGVRWTIGDVSPRGFEALRLSVLGAFSLFGLDARYGVCVNTIPPAEARIRCGEFPFEVEWHDATFDVPEFLRAHFDGAMAEGVGWKLAPMRYFTDMKELALDNDCILWDMPAAIREWLATEDYVTCVVAEDVAACFGQFGDLCECGPRNGGIRGLPAGFDLRSAIEAVLALRPGLVLSSELDEQGLQTAAINRCGRPLVVTLEEVSICSPFKPHVPHLGSCGAHFCGLNARCFRWEWEGRNASEYIAAHWDGLREEIAERVGGAVQAR
jgi:hypothetical protein